MSPQEIESAVTEIRDRVRERHQKTVAEIDGFELPSLDPLGRARDAAEGKAASIGRVNPRTGGVVNNSIQFVKGVIARSLNWLVRDQIDYNRAVVTYMERVIETLVEQNHNIVRVAQGLVETRNNVSSEFDRTREELAQRGRELADLSEIQHDILNHWQTWRPEYEERATNNEIKFLHLVREVEGAARQREEAVGARAAEMHQKYSELLSSTAATLQQKFWTDMQQQRAEHEKLIHTELRLIRRRGAAEAMPTDSSPTAPVQAAVAASPHFDYVRFEERFRGSEEYVAANQQRYLEICRGLAPVVDLGCGRGELLGLFRAEGVACMGVDADPDAIAACLEKGLNGEVGDLFGYLDRQEDGSLGAILSAHVVEHLPPLRLPELVELAARKLKPGGVLALETPNPACLAIFAGDFYLDPTHQRPVPSKQLGFYMEESGFGAIEVRELNPAYELIPELTTLREHAPAGPFVEKFFGGLDYVIVGKKL